MKDNLNMWVNLVEPRLSALHFGGANAIGVVEDLAVQVRQVDRVRINDANSSNASGSEIKKGW
jgi:hypothetical protein